MEQSKLIIIGAVIIGLLLLLGGMAWAVQSFSFKMATFDMDKIVKDSEAGQDMKNDINNKGAQLKARFDLAKTDAEKSAITNENAKYQSDRQNEFLSQVKKAVAKVSKQKGISAVGSPQVYIYCSNDITDDVIKELAK